jgi:gluconolactonase
VAGAKALERSQRQGSVPCHRPPATPRWTSTGRPHPEQSRPPQRLDDHIPEEHAVNHPPPSSVVAVQGPTCTAALIVFLLAAAGRLPALDWDGMFAISPVSAPQLVLAAVDNGAGDGTRVSLALPAAEAPRGWRISAKGDGFYKIQPSSSPTLVLAVAAGGSANGTAIVLETDAGKPWQSWSITRNPAGSWCLSPQHAPGKGLDDYAGGNQPGAKQDLWDSTPGDEHLSWELKPLAGATMPAAAAPPPAAPQGTLKEFTYSASTIYPGTNRSGTVFIPAQYDGSAPACVYVRQDGYNAREKPMLEALIAAKDMPVTIAIFIRPGDLPAPLKDTLGRRNRCFEYDGVGDTYVRFLLEELLPYVATTFSLKLSERGSDRCIGGISSGGIAAFNAAWERPDAFSRVYACSGSFVSFRGGNEIPTLIRKYEAKPIRAYLTTGSNDMENCAGDWFLLDQEMDKALKFSGYDYVFRSLIGGHGTGWNENFAEAMRFCWKGWPEAVKAGPGAPRVRDVLSDGSAWQLAGEGYQDARGPACNSKGEVFFADAAANTIFRISLDGTIHAVAADSGQANCCAVGPKDELYSASGRTGTITAWGADGKGRVVAAGIRARHLLARPDGGLYVTGVAEGDAADAGKVWLVTDGHKTVVEAGIAAATGLAYRPDQWLLAVADGRSKWAYSLAIKPDGTLSDKERFFWLQLADLDDDAGAEGLCYAKEGQLFVATRLGIQVCADDGPTQTILPLPDRARALGVCLGGAEMNTLFAFSAGKIWKRTVKVHAMGAFTPWTKVHGTPL